MKSDQNQKAVEEFQKIAHHYEDKGLSSKATAIYKKITKLNPEDLNAKRKLADLYKQQGFVSEAKNEFRELATQLGKKNKVEEAVSAYESLLGLDPGDISSRLTLAELCTKTGKIERALEELNTSAEYNLRTNKLKEAEEILSVAKDLKKDHLRTLTNLIDLFKKENKKKDALNLINEILSKEKDNIKTLYLLGNFYLEDQEFDKAGEIFEKIMSISPKEADARVKLGKIFIRNGELDRAFELYENLVDTLIRKHKEDKAIGLLGMILAAKKIHLPTLEKLYSVFKENKQEKNFETVAQIILDEYKSRNLREKTLSVLADLVFLFPDNQDYRNEYGELQKELGISDKEESEDLPIQLDVEKEMLDANLAKADLYIKQGLIRNARRILENLRLKFQNDPRIEEKITQLERLSSQSTEEEIHEKIEKVKKEENGIFSEIDKTMESDSTRSFQGALNEEKLTSADIFAETDIIPLVSPDDRHHHYFDLSEKIKQENDAIKFIVSYQMRGDTTIVEKALSDIVTEFRKALDEKVDKEDYESHYNLGIAFLEQGLLDEAIEELKLASLDKMFELESYSVISLCYKKKKEYNESLKWLEKALSIAEKETTQWFALKYELACLYEEMKDNKNALKLFEEVNEWNPKYRDVAERMQSSDKKE